MNSLLNNSSAPTFDHPLEMLRACHGRIEAQCITLNRLVRHVKKHGGDEQAVQAARAILRYFDTAGQHHHQDEEQDLFPQLLATHDTSASALVTRLAHEHIALDAAWQNLRPLLLNLVEAQAQALDAAIVHQFIEVYAKHIAHENKTLLPLAATLLNETQLRSMGQSMAARRGVTL
jgi:hemerythrin-like domain-containing protein